MTLKLKAGHSAPHSSGCVVSSGRRVGPELGGRAQGGAQLMSRYISRPSFKGRAREFPYTVEITMPEGGLGRALERMYEFHVLRGIKPRSGVGRGVDDCDVINWLFADPDIAQAFADEFNGTMLLPPTIL